MGKSAFLVSLSLSLCCFALGRGKAPEKGKKNSRAEPLFVYCPRTGKRRSPHHLRQSALPGRFFVLSSAGSERTPIPPSTAIDSRLSSQPPQWLRLCLGFAAGIRLIRLPPGSVTVTRRSVFFFLCARNTQVPPSISPFEYAFVSMYRILVRSEISFLQHEERKGGGMGGIVKGRKGSARHAEREEEGNREVGGTRNGRVNRRGYKEGRIICKMGRSSMRRRTKERVRKGGGRR